MMLKNKIPKILTSEEPSIKKMSASNPNKIKIEKTDLLAFNNFNSFVTCLLFFLYSRCMSLVYYISNLGMKKEFNSQYNKEYKDNT